MASAPLLAILLAGLSPITPALEASSVAPPESLSGESLVSALRQGGYVILMRHASSPRTPPDAQHASRDNVTGERELDETGRSSAPAMGAALRTLHIPVGQVISSPTYRALETARLAGLGEPKTRSELGDSGHSMQADPSGMRGAWLRAEVAQAPARRTNTIIITHLPNIHEAFPESSGDLADGEALIFHPDGHSQASLVARMKMDAWEQLASER